MAFLALLLAASLAQARCPDAYDRLAMDARGKLGEELSCEDMQAAARLLPVEVYSTTTGDWAFSGEKKLRQALSAMDIEVPADILPIGYVERKAPAGSVNLAVFGLHMPDRLALLASLARVEGSVDPAELAPRMGGGAWYDRVAFFWRKSGEERYKPGARWVTFRRGGLWGRHQAIQRTLRACPPCRGWLCPRDPPVCFSDFNEDGPEEMHLTDDCREGLCGMALFDPEEKGSARLMFNAMLQPTLWEERPEGWVLVPRPGCKGAVFCVTRGKSLGDPTCERPTVYLLRRGSRQLEASAALTDEYYPVAARTAPKGCEMGGGAVQVWAAGSGFVVYRKP